MLGSQLCPTYNSTAEEKTGMEECAFDKGGYFIIKGSEKVLVGQ